MGMGAQMVYVPMAMGNGGTMARETMVETTLGRADIHIERGGKQRAASCNAQMHGPVEPQEEEIHA